MQIKFYRKHDKENEKTRVCSEFTTIKVLKLKLCLRRATMEAIIEQNNRNGLNWTCEI